MKHLIRFWSEKTNDRPEKLPNSTWIVKLEPWNYFDRVWCVQRFIIWFGSQKISSLSLPSFPPLNRQHFSCIIAARADSEPKCLITRSPVDVPRRIFWRDLIYFVWILKPCWTSARCDDTRNILWQTSRKLHFSASAWLAIFCMNLSIPKPKSGRLKIQNHFDKNECGEHLCQPEVMGFNISRGFIAFLSTRPVAFYNFYHARFPQIELDVDDGFKNRSHASKNNIKNHLIERLNTFEIESGSDILSHHYVTSSMSHLIGTVINNAINFYRREIYDDLSHSICLNNSCRRHVRAALFVIHFVFYFWSFYLYERISAWWREGGRWKEGWDINVSILFPSMNHSLIELKC